MTVLGTALRPAATKVMLLGSGELGKEVAIECQRLGIETIAVDRYPDAPAMQVAHRAHVINMLHGESLRALIEQEKPDYIVPEIEAIATDTLVELEQAGQKVVPTARAAKLTMNREGIRRPPGGGRAAASHLRYRFADSEEGFRAAVTEIGLPCIVKPVMSSSGKGQSFIRSADQLSEAWRYAQQGGRAGAGRVIVEGGELRFRNHPAHRQRCRWRAFLRSVGHRQEDGDYRESWQPQQMSDLALERAQAIAREVVLALGGYGLFGVELFVCGDEVIFSEVSRDHTTPGW